MNKKLTSISVSLFAIAFASATQAYAQTDLEMLWKKLDTDGNGIISVEEGAESKIVESQWGSVDLNRDNQLTFREFSLVQLPKS